MNLINRIKRLFASDSVNEHRKLYSHCDICGEKLKGNTKGSHLISEHPEYSASVGRHIYIGNYPFTTRIGVWYNVE